MYVHTRTSNSVRRISLGRDGFFPFVPLPITQPFMCLDSNCQDTRSLGPVISHVLYSVTYCLL